MKKFILSLITFLFFAGVLVWAGTTTNTSAPTPTGHSIADIYALIEGTTPPTPSLSPSVSTSEATMHSISELYVTLANLINPASTTVPYLGITPGVTPDEVTAFSKEFSPTSEAGTVTGFTLQDIDNLINNTRVTTPTHSDFAPASTPADSGPTLDEIYTSLSTLITASDIATGTTYLGVLGTYEAEPPPLTLPSIVYNGSPLYIYPTDSGEFPWDDNTCTGEFMETCQTTDALSDTNGSENTATIVTAGIEGSAKVCSELSFDSYDDWYLPASDQLRSIYAGQGNVDKGDYEEEWVDLVSPLACFPGGPVYWSSSEAPGGNRAYALKDCGGVNTYDEAKYYSLLTRCVRSD